MRTRPPNVTSCYRMGGSSVALDLSLEDIRRAREDQDGLLWVDIAATDDRGEGEAILRDIFGFHPLTIDDCYNALLDPPKVDDYGSYLFIIVHDVQYDGIELRTGELNLYAGRNYVVSFHKQPTRAVSAVRLRAEQHNLVLDHGADFLLHALIDVVVDDFHPIVRNLDEQIATIEERVLSRPDSETLQAVLQLRRVVQQLKRSIAPQRDTVNRFARGEYGLIKRESLMYFRDIYDHTVRVESMLDSLRDLADSALNIYLSSTNNRLQEVMKTLTIVAVIFLPLTLIASIYGTNFDDTVPQYAADWGFGGMVASMLFIIAGLLALFRWRRWI